MRLSFFLTLFLIIISAISTSEANEKKNVEYREWTDQKTGMTVNASLINIDYVKQTICIRRTSDGWIFNLPFKTLILTDICYLLSIKEKNFFYEKGFPSAQLENVEDFVFLGTIDDIFKSNCTDFFDNKKISVFAGQWSKTGSATKSQNSEENQSKASGSISIAFESEKTGFIFDPQYPLIRRAFTCKTSMDKKYIKLAFDKTSSLNIVVDSAQTFPFLKESNETTSTITFEFFYGYLFGTCEDGIKLTLVQQNLEKYTKMCQKFQENQAESTKTTENFLEPNIKNNLGTKSAFYKGTCQFDDKKETKQFLAMRVESIEDKSFHGTIWQFSPRKPDETNPRKYEGTVFDLGKGVASFQINLNKNPSLGKEGLSKIEKAFLSGSVSFNSEDRMSETSQSIIFTVIDDYTAVSKGYFFDPSNKKKVRCEIELEKFKNVDDAKAFFKP